QGVVNGEVAAALRRLSAQLDPSDPGSAVGGLWSELAGVAARVEVLERRLRALEGTGETSRVDALEATAQAFSAELAPLGSLRAAVDDLEARLAELERTRGRSRAERQ